MLSSIVSQCENDIASKLFGDFSYGKEINSFASSLWEVSISKPNTSTKTPAYNITIAGSI